MSVTVNLKHQALQVVAGSTTTLTANLELVDDASGTYVATWYANNLGEFDIQRACVGARLVRLHSSSIAGATSRARCHCSGAPTLTASSRRWPFGSKK